MAEQRTIAYTGDDLIEIGRSVNKITRRLKAFEAYSGSDIEDKVDNLSIQVLLDNEAVGELVYEDGWIGFLPYPVREV